MVDKGSKNNFHLAQTGQHKQLQSRLKPKNPNNQHLARPTANFAHPKTMAKLNVPQKDHWCHCARADLSSHSLLSRRSNCVRRAWGPWLLQAKGPTRQTHLLPSLLVRPGVELEQDTVDKKLQVWVKPRGPEACSQPRRDGNVRQGVQQLQEGPRHGVLLVAALNLFQFNLIRTEQCNTILQGVAKSECWISFS